HVNEVLDIRIGELREPSGDSPTASAHADNGYTRAVRSGAAPTERHGSGGCRLKKVAPVHHIDPSSSTQLDGVDPFMMQGHCTRGAQSKRIEIARGDRGTRLS